MVFYSQVDKRGLLELLGGQSSGLRITPLETFDRNLDSLGCAKEGYVLIWPEDRGRRVDFPTAIVVRGDEKRSFFAWAATYLPKLLPFTGYCRVLTTAEYVAHRTWVSSSSFKYSRGIWLGAIIGEALESAGGRFDSTALPLSAFSSTKLFSIARSIGRGSSMSESQKVAERWERLRRLSQDREQVGSSVRGQAEERRTRLRPILEGVVASLYAIGDADRKTEGLVGSRGQAASRQAIGRVLEAQFGVVLSDLSFQDSIFEADQPREVKFRLYEEFVERLSNGPLGSSIVSGVLAGYFLSLVAPGSLIYADHLLKDLRRFPGALLWYGTWAGLSSRGSLEHEMNGIGRRIAKELEFEEIPWSRPRCDIEFEELEMLSIEKPGSWETRVAAPGQLMVELAPLVYTRARWQSGEAQGEGSREAKEVQARERRIGRELRRWLVQGQSIVDKLERDERSGREDLKSAAIGAPDPKNKTRSKKP